MARTKKVTTERVDTRSAEEKELSYLTTRIQSKTFNDEDKAQMDELIKVLNEKGMTHPYQGVGRFYAVMVDGEDEAILFRLVASNPSFNAETPEASIEAPMGNAVRFMNDGDITSYSVNGNEVVITLLASADTYEELEAKVTTKDPVKKLGEM